MFNIILICIYASTEKDDEEITDTLYGKLERNQKPTEV